MKGSIESFVNLLIYVLIFVTAVSSLALIAHGTPTAQSECVIGQSAIINNLKLKISEANQKGVTIPYSFDVLDCAKCIWYDKDQEALMVAYAVRKGFLSKEQIMYVPYHGILADFFNIGCGCSSCGWCDVFGCHDQNSSNYCANIRSGVNSPYQLEISKNSIKCLNCVGAYDTTNYCPIEHESCVCPSGLCKKLNCGDSIINSSLTYAGEEKYFQYILTAPKNIEIKLTTDNGNSYGLSAVWADNSCPGSGVRWDCIDGMRSPQLCNHNNLQSGTYHIRISRYGSNPMNYSLSLTCS